ncbi:MAG: hypothetical protein ACI8ZM_001393 [Crocinitomix sp.]|jgi:hypothetical protein
MKNCFLLLIIIGFSACELEEDQIISEITTQFENDLAVDLSAIDSDFKAIILYPKIGLVEEDVQEDYDSLQNKMNADKDSVILQWTQRLEASSDEIEKFRIQSKIELYKKWNPVGEVALKLCGLMSSYTSKNNIGKNTFVCIPVNSSTDLGELQKHSTAHGVRYLVNILEVQFYKEENQIMTHVNVQLYDSQKGEIVLIIKARGNSIDDLCWFHLGSDKSKILTSISNVCWLTQIELYQHIDNNTHWEIERSALLEKRAKIWDDRYYKQEPLQSIPTIIANSNPEIEITSYYHGFMNEEKNEFIAFFLYPMDDEFYEKELHKNRNTVSIIENHMQVRGHVVAGILHENKWVLDEHDHEEFYTKNLDSAKRIFFTNYDKWDFLLYNEDDSIHDIWQSRVFDKHPNYYEELKTDKSEDDDWWINYHNHHLHSGLPKLVAQKLLSHEKTVAENWEEQILKPIWTDFYESLIQADPVQFADYNLLNLDHFVNIYSRKKDAVLQPMLTESKSDDRTFQFFVLTPKTGKIYNWTYFPTEDFHKQSRHYGALTVERISSITPWNFTCDFLEYAPFWEEFILKKENGTYKYLTPIDY